MGVNSGTAQLLLEEHAARPFSGSLLQLGRMHIHFGAAHLRQMLDRYGVEPANRAELDAIEDSRRLLSDQEFWGVFGFEAVDALDYGGFLGAAIDFDLNRDDLPAEHHGRYGCVYDGGTMEHVFHIPNFLGTLFDLLAEGGRVVHLNPASNSVEHGFYSFSPCFYRDFYTASGFRIDSFKLVNLGSRLWPIRLTAYECSPPIPRKILDGYLSKNVHHMWCVAAKVSGATRGAVPQQGAYLDQWSEGVQPPGAGVAPSPASGPLASLKRFIKRRPLLDRCIRRVGHPFFRLQRRLATRRALNACQRRYPR